MRRILGYIGFLLFIAVPLGFAQVQVGDNLHLSGGGLVTFGYSGDYGNDIPSDHGLNFGLNGTTTGYYYNPNFVSFNVTPYYNESRSDSSYQSLTGGSGVAASANLFTGSHFPGSISYHDDHNSVGTFGLAGLPDFTTHGNDQGFGIGWSALLPGLPTLSANYAQGDGGSNVYGTNEQSNSSSKIFNLRSNYTIEGFRLNAFYDHTNFDSTFPSFLSGEPDSVENSTGHDEGIGANHSLPVHGTFYADFIRSTDSSDFASLSQNTVGYTTDNENSGASFHPTQKLTFFVNQGYVDNLSGYLSQNLINNGVAAPVVNLGSTSNSLTFGGGMGYQITNYLQSQAQATYYQQRYFGKDYSGAYISGTLSCAKKLFNMFSFSGGVVESTNGQGTNAVGFLGTVNYFRRYDGWDTSASFSYAQNVQSFLITYTTSYYNYTGRVRRRLAGNLRWSAGVTGSHSGLTNQPGSVDHSEGFFTSLGSSKFTLTGNFDQSSGNSVLGANGLVIVQPTPGLPSSNMIIFSGDSYGGGISATPLRRLTLSFTYNRALNTTLSSYSSRNNTEIINSQLQYRLRRISLLAGYTQFSQGISAAGLPPATVNSFFVGVSRWFNLF